MDSFIEIKGACVHNLKNIDVRIPKGKLTVITGVSGSGKSSLAFDTLYEEGKRRYLMFSGTQFMVDSAPAFSGITGLSPTVAVEQRIIRQSNPRSTVGTRTKLSNMLAVLFAACGRQDDAYAHDTPLGMEMFLKNSPKGMCVTCLGSGRSMQIDEKALFSDGSQKIVDVCMGLGRRGSTRRMLDSFYRHYGLTPDQPLDSLTEAQLQALKYGDGGKTPFMGYIPWMMLIMTTSTSGRLRYLLTQAGLLKNIACPKCGGTGLGPYAMHTKIGGYTISDFERLYISDLYAALTEIYVSESRAAQTGLWEEIIKKLNCLIDVGLQHVALSRPVPTLSGGEIQRLFLASYIIAEMDAIIFVFDEPTIGLHEREKQKLIDILRNLVNRGNTVVAVEHDRNFIENADYIVDLGPDAGVLGGERIFQGGYSDFLACGPSRTAPYLTGQKTLTRTSPIRPVDVNKKLTIDNAHIHNLRHIRVDIPLGVIVGIAGVSGSGKSSLITDTLVPGLKGLLASHNDGAEAENETETPIEADVTEDVIFYGYDQISRVVVVDQKPIGRTRTSCPATYTGMFDRIRALFARSPEAKAKGYKIGLFSVNAAGCCLSCKGHGERYFHVGFGNFVNLTCEDCAGTGYTQEALAVRMNGKNILDVLTMSVTEAYSYFSDEASPAYDRTVSHMLATLERVGMGYIRLGQKTPTISGGEAQRIKLAKELGKRQKKRSLYILDEPTTGLSFEDTKRLIKLLHELCDSGQSVLVTEHDPSVLSHCDYIIELGPGGGRDGGLVIASGSPPELKKDPRSIIGGYLPC